MAQFNIGDIVYLRPGVNEKCVYWPRYDTPYTVKIERSLADVAHIELNEFDSGYWPTYLFMAKEEYFKSSRQDTEFLEVMRSTERLLEI